MTECDYVKELESGKMFCPIMTGWCYDTGNYKCGFRLREDRIVDLRRKASSEEIFGLLVRS